MTYQPPFQLTHTMMSHVAKIAELVGVWNTVNRQQMVPELRRCNRIKTIQASLAIEQNTLTLEQVTAVLDGKHVPGLPREIQEVRSAFRAYESLEAWQATSRNTTGSLVKPTGVLIAADLFTFSLVPSNGPWKKLLPAKLPMCR